MQVSIREVKDNTDIIQFVKFPFALYKDNQQWVPPLIIEEVNTFDKTKNPILKDTDIALLLAYQDDHIVGRIAAIINHKDLAYHNYKKGRFGWFDCIDDRTVSNQLLIHAENWLRSKGMDSVEGPVGFNNLDKAGLLINGFDEISNITTLYNHAYYEDHLLAAGFQPLKDWIEYRFRVPDHIPDRITRFSKLIAKRYNLTTIKSHSKQEFSKFTKEIFKLMNKTHGDLHGFVPFDDKLIDYYAKKYIRIIKPEFTSIVTDEHEQVIAFGLAIPSLSKAFQKSNGKLLPLGWYHIRRAVKQNDVADLLLIGVAPEYQRKAVPALIFNQIIQAFIDHGIKYVESNPELETNQSIRTMMEKYDHRQHKRRRSFIKNLI